MEKAAPQRKVGMLCLCFLRQENDEIHETHQSCYTIFQKREQTDGQ